AKLYLFGQHRAIVTSANLTETALSRNHEFGFVADEAEILVRCNQYFEALWQQAEPDLTGIMLDSWESELTAARLNRTPRRPTPQLRDYGAACSLAQQPIIIPPVYSEAPRAFVKFFGEGHNRAEHSMLVFDEVQRSGCHWACTYPKNKRPRQVED